jgi:glycosyltransferase 2 family protein
MKRHLKTIVGVALSVLLLAWAVRDVSFQEVLHELRHAHPGLFLLGVLITIAGLAIRALRWGVLLRPIDPPARSSFRARFASVVVGFAANNVLPARIGEFARAFTLSRIAPVGIGAAFATLVVERIFDAVALISLLFFAMASADFPATGQIAGIDPRAAARLIAIVMGLVALVLFAMVVAPAFFLRTAERLTRRLPTRFGSGLLAALQSFLGGLRVLRSGKLFVLSLGLALLQWWFTGWSFLVTFRAFGITEVGMSGALFLQSLISLAVAIPSSPGFFGPFEAAARVGLAFWGVPSDKAISFAVGFHLGGFIPVTLMGFYYVARLNLSWRDVQHSDEIVEEQVDGPGAAGARGI